jgi:DNA invertase Pin-like site-specific DNA recombinase
MQQSAMREYAHRRGWQVVVCFDEIGSSGKQRPKREELLVAARRRQIDMILVWRLDRWGRSVADLVSTLNELNAIGVGFASVTEALDFTTPSGRAMIGMIAVFAEFERDILRDRVKAGIAEVRSRGQRHGRPATTKKHATDAQAMFEEGLSKRRIAAKLGIGRASVRRLLAESTATDSPETTGLSMRALAPP